MGVLFGTAVFLFAQNGDLADVTARAQGDWQFRWPLIRHQ